MSENTPSRRRRRGGIFFPLLLVAIGVIILLINLGVVTGDIWNMILQLWPILLIVIGLDSIFKREGMAAPTFLIGIGVVFLLANLGFLSVNTWQMVFTLWPILLIAFGFDILVGRRSLLLSLLGMAVIIVILVGSLWVFGVNFSGGNVVSGEQIQQSLNGATRASVVIESSSGELKIGSMSQPEILLDGRVPSVDEEKIRSSYTVSGGEGTYRLSDTGAQIFFPTRRAQDWFWDLDITDSIPVGLGLSMGAGSVDAGLRDLNLENLTVNLAIGETTVTLPDQGRLNAQLEGAIGHIVIIVPRGVGVRIKADTGLASLNVPDSYLRVGDAYKSPNYDSADNRVDIVASIAIGSVDIRQE
jgi:LiaI-LiaF-like transmembrane region/Cell wall-active antibiotics response LiaF, C-terminal